MRRLSKAGRSADVVRLAERWRDEASLPREARLLVARGLLDLLQYDRAWMELRSLTDEDDGDLEAHLLTAGLFAERGWTERARAVLASVAATEPEHPRLPSLERQLEAVVAPPPTDVRSVEASGAPVKVLQAAEALLRAGSSLRAQGVLERLRPRAGALEDRVEALLWALRGDYSSGSQTLEELCEHVRSGLPAPSVLPRLAPAQGLDAREWEALELTESGLSVDPETAEITRSAVAIAAAGRADPAFPSLFRSHDADDLSLDDDDEVTVASVMANEEQMVDPPTAENTDAGIGFEDDMGGDTQILEIIPRAQPEAAESPGAESARQTFDLRTLGASSEVLPDAEEEVLEEEDEDLVVLTRRASREEPEQVARAERPPIQVVEKVPEPPPLPDNLPGEDEDTPSLTPVVEPGGVMGTPGSTLEGPATRRTGGQRTSVLLGLALGLSILVLLLFAFGR